MTFSYTFNQEDNSGEAIVFTATIDSDSDPSCPYYTSTIELNSYAANAVLNLPMVITPEKLRDCANKLESFLSQNSVKHISSEEKNKLASDSNTPQKTLELLATDEYFVVRRWVAKNPNTPIKTLELLATDEDCSVRYWVAQHPNTPPKTLELLATDEDCSVRYWVAYNPNTPSKTLELLATDKNSDVRWRVAKNPNYQKSIKLSVKEVNTLKTLLDSTQSEELKSIARKL